ncbi:MAG: hypothetical protein HKN20_05730 [Gemmatimonadetes bacterium]|nr:hypothetical protein [Gemmatimonadota bacterium]
MYDLLEALKHDLRDLPAMTDPAEGEIESILPRLTHALPDLTQGAVPYDRVLHAAETLILLSRLALPDHPRILDVLERGRTRTLGQATAALVRVATVVLERSGPRVAATIDTFLEDVRTVTGTAIEYLEEGRTLRAAWLIGYFHEQSEDGEVVLPALGFEAGGSLKGRLLDFLERAETIRRTGLLKSRTQEGNDLYRLQVYCGNAIDRIEFLQLQLGAGAAIKWEFPDRRNGWRDCVVAIEPEALS